MKNVPLSRCTKNEPNIQHAWKPIPYDASTEGLLCRVHLGHQNPWSHERFQTFCEYLRCVVSYKIVKRTLGQSPTGSTVSILVIVDVTCVNKTLSGTRTYSIVSTLSGDQEACSYQCPSQPLGDYLRYVVSYQTVTKKTKNTLLRPSPSSLTLTHTVPVPIYAL